MSIDSNQSEKFDHLVKDVHDLDQQSKNLQASDPSITSIWKKTEELLQRSNALSMPPELKERCLNLQQQILEIQQGLLDLRQQKVEKMLPKQIDEYQQLLSGHLEMWLIQCLALREFPSSSDAATGQMIEKIFHEGEKLFATLELFHEIDPILDEAVEQVTQEMQKLQLNKWLIDSTNFKNAIVPGSILFDPKKEKTRQELLELGKQLLASLPFQNDSSNLEDQKAQVSQNIRALEENVPIKKTANLKFELGDQKNRRKEVNEQLIKFIGWAFAFKTSESKTLFSPEQVEELKDFLKKDYVQIKESKTIQRDIERAWNLIRERFEEARQTDPEANQYWESQQDDFYTSIKNLRDHILDLPQ